MYRLYVRLNEDKTPSHASLLGYDQPDAKVVYWHMDTIILKVPGFSYWCQLPPGPTHSYAPAEFQVYKVTKREDVGLIQNLEAEQLATFPVKC